MHTYGIFLGMGGNGIQLPAREIVRQEWGGTINTRVLCGFQPQMKGNFYCGMLMFFFVVEIESHQRKRSESWLWEDIKYNKMVGSSVFFNGREIFCGFGN